MTAHLLLFALQVRILTLDDAVGTAVRQQPTVRQAQAELNVARAQEGEARAPLLPQVTGVAGYQRTTANFAPRPGSVPSNLTMTMGSSFDTFNFFSFTAQATQLIYDFSQTSAKWRSAQALTEGKAQAERQQELEVVLGVRNAYFAARAAKELVRVARETLQNQDRHLGQIKGFVQIGTRPEIDLAQAKTDRANALVASINADNGYEIAKAQLNQAMGVETGLDYDVADETLGAVQGEDQDAPLVDEALRSRPDVQSIIAQLRAQELGLRSARGGYGPSLAAGMGVSDVGRDLDALAWNWNGSLTLTWLLFEGLQQKKLVEEEEAHIASFQAQRDAQRQRVRLEVDQTRLAVRAAKAAVGAAAEALANARVRLRLAEGRYQAGVGNIIELGDAQVALTTAAAQKVQADYNVSSARAQLLRALGRR